MPWRYSIRDDDPLSARYVLNQTYEMGRDGWRVTLRSQTAMCSDRDKFYLSGTLTAEENGAVVATRSWDEVVPRDLV